MTQSKSWGEREAELLTALRPHCDTDEITTILNALGFDRSREAVSRKGRRVGIKFHAYSDPTGEFSEKESAAIDAIVSKRKPGLITPAPLTSEDVREIIQEDYFNGIGEWEDSDGFDEPVIEEDIREKYPDINWAPTSLPLKSGRMTKFIMLNDVHVPHNIPLDAIFRYISDFKPDYILLVGDIINNDPFNHWAKKSPRKAKHLPLPKAYYRMCNNLFYKPLREAVGKGCTIVHWEGNHEYWARRAIDEMPEGEGYWEVWNNVEEVDQWIPSKGFARLGKLWFTHGEIIKGGMYHAKLMLAYFNRNIRYGHRHDSSSWSATSPIDIKERHTSRCCGTLEKFNPQFMEDRPHDWQHMFTQGWIRPDGTFNDYSVNIINDAFIVDGKEYISTESKLNQKKETDAPPVLTSSRRAS